MGKIPIFALGNLTLIQKDNDCNMKKFLTAILLTFSVLAISMPRQKYNFNPNWQMRVGDAELQEIMRASKSAFQTVTLPHAFNEDEAFRLDIHDLTDTIVWYRKTFTLPADARGRKVFIEFEGARQGIDVYVNGTKVGFHENGVMAFGFDLTDFVRVGKTNVIAVRIDNSWTYRERAYNQRYQWNDKNFNANYGGLPKNVWLHITDRVYQTLPLYSTLGTVGTYVYASQMDVQARRAVIHVESEVRNETSKPVTRTLRVAIEDRDGTIIARYQGTPVTIPAQGRAVLSASQPVNDLHFWSWGYGYLYKVRTWLDQDQGDVIVTGFRKTRFAEGKVWLNDRVLQMKGYAQRTSNEWPAVGMSVPAWLSDYSNGLMVQACGNLVRWMHVTPWKQDIESCDRVGLIQAMPAGDSEKDVTGRRWDQRKLLMRDAIIYNRNNPSILFYECGNESISQEHMLEMRALRDSFDYYGGRAIGSREMLDIREAEYGGEMLYINKSAHSPMWAMEYCRDEALRKYWDEQSYPFHREGAGNSEYHSTVTNSSSKQADASAYNHNQDEFVIEHVHRWWDYYVERPGTGRRVSSGGAKIIFSDSNTHFRGTENYRRSGDVDPMRLPKDVYYAHQVMWDGWVDIEQPRLHIVGHWNYSPTSASPEGEKPVVKNVYVVANTDSVALFLNGKPLPQNAIPLSAVVDSKRGLHKQQWQFLFTFPDVQFEPGQLEAVGYNTNAASPLEGDGAVVRASLHTAGQPHHIVLRSIENPMGWKADGADLALVEAEVVDAQGRRCPLANDTLQFALDGQAEWRGGIALGTGYSEALQMPSTNWILCRQLPAECGVNRVLLRSTTQPGTVRLTATAPGLQSAELTLHTQSMQPYTVNDALSTYQPVLQLAGNLSRGETPSSPSYHDRAVDVEILSAKAGANSDEAVKSFDDNELSEWKNDGRLSTAWITYQLARMAQVDEVCIKLTGWRMRSYPIEIFADNELVWSGETERSLGYVHIPIQPRMARSITIRLCGAAQEQDAFGQITEVAAPAAGELDLFKAVGGSEVKNELRIVEVEFKENLMK